MEKDKQQQLQEFDPATLGVTAAVVLIPLAINLAMLFGFLKLMITKSKADAKLSKQLNGILKDGKNWKVIIVDDPSPNAFAMIKPYVFLTKGLFKVMNDNEVMAIMLHEAGHINNHDVWKNLIADSSFKAILFSAVAVLAGPAAFYSLLMFYGLIGKHIMMIVMNRTMGRAAENRADNFAVKYGYGDHLVTALNKIEEMVAKMRAKSGRECGPVCKAGEKVAEMIDEHPPLKQRVENILKAKETWEKAKNATFVNLRNFFQKAFGVVKK